MVAVRETTGVGYTALVRMIEAGEDVVRRLRSRADEIDAEVRILRIAAGDLAPPPIG